MLLLCIFLLVLLMWEKIYKTRLFGAASSFSWCVLISNRGKESGMSLEIQLYLIKADYVSFLSHLDSAYKLLLWALGPISGPAIELGSYLFKKIDNVLSPLINWIMRNWFCCQCANIWTCPLTGRNWEIWILSMFYSCSSTALILFRARMLWHYYSCCGNDW